MTEPEITPENEAQPDENVIPFPESDADPRDTKIAELEAEVAKLRDHWVRAAAETDNIRKRAQRDIDETRKYAVTSFAADMVSVLENLKRASESISADARVENELLNILGQGVDLTLQELLSAFERYHITRIDPMGQKFDHNFHQAVVQVEQEGIEPGTVVQVVQAGYVIGDRLLRPAMVAVTKAAGEPVKKVDTSA